MVTDEDMERALAFLADTDDKSAALKADMERLHYLAKRTESAVFLHLKGTVAERNAAADVAPDVKDAWSNYFDAVRAYNAVANKRATEDLVIRVWQSMGANRRRA